jgi:lipid II isoglutaminyl synthase (glutamine-hydrolysing)
MNLHLILATWAAKLARRTSRSLGRGSGSALPGLVALRICPTYITRLTKNFTHGTVVITGTNGKTTTAALLAAIAREHGWNVVHNRAGSNLTRGVAAALVEAAGPSGRLRADLGIFEIDEATMPEAVTALGPRLIGITNLFRDQLDRYGELDTTARLIQQSLEAAPDAEILLCADDPLVAWIGRGKEGVRYFGLDQDSYLTDEFERATDSRDCPVCGTELTYRANYYGHLGRWSCPTGDFSRPTPEFSVSQVTLQGFTGSDLVMRLGEEETSLHFPLPGLYSAYNALAAAAMARTLDIPRSTVKHALTGYHNLFGRIERVEVAGKELVMILVKNPAGCNQALSLLELEGGTKPLLLALNDRFADGTDVSWIWDCDLERIRGRSHAVTTSGIRAADLTLRLKYAGVDPSDITQVDDLGEALDHSLGKLRSGERLYVLPTYTAMLELRRILKSRGHLRELLEANRA